MHGLLTAMTDGPSLSADKITTNTVSQQCEVVCHGAY